MTQTRPDILSPLAYEGSGLVTYEPGQAQQGYTLIQGIFPGGSQVRLIDMDGQEVHIWTIDYFDVWSDPTHVVPAGNLPKSEFSYHTQGFWPSPDGSIVTNISNIGTVRLDMCSEVIWTLERMAHHSITRTDDGSFWIPSHISVFDTPDELLPSNRTAEEIASELIGQIINYNNSVVLVTADGAVEKEFSVLQAINDAGLEHALYSSAQENRNDPTHINDIEVVTEALAERIDGVSQGDIVGPDARLVFGLNGAKTETDESSVLDGEYGEVSFGYAYRPTEDNRLNVLARYRYLHDLYGQRFDDVDEDGPRQRSHVVSVDASYGLNQRWTLGGKIGYRLSETADDDASPFVQNDALLTAVNLRYHLAHTWETLIELRNFQTVQGGTSDTAVLAAAYRHLGNNLKVGLGYNFGSFSDNLTDLSQDDKGVFLNIIAKF